MADDEQFSLCWNNFNTNLSAGFHESLCRGDLVDVTLAAEGHLVKAHRLVLSVCSPYFRKMFTQMPHNQHAFVFLKDVTHSALKDLIQFMYCGEVNVKHDALPAFISTAEALQIKGLTETAETTTPAPPSPTKAPPPAPTPIPSTSTTSPRVRIPQRNASSRPSYKLESEDSSDDHRPTPVVQQHHQQHQQQHTPQPQQQQPPLQHTQKRAAQRSITPQSVPTAKRVKNIDPLEATESVVQPETPMADKSGEAEFIDLPIETIPTKSEPEYADDTAEIDADAQDQDQEATYVEDDSYGDMKYDETYFTENEDNQKPSVSGFSETFEGDQSATEAQEFYKVQIIDAPLRFIRSPWSTPCLIIDDFIYNCHSTRGGIGYWRCHNYSKKNVSARCRARCVVKDGQLRSLTGGDHNHPQHTEKIRKIENKYLTTKTEYSQEDILSVVSKSVLNIEKVEFENVL